MLRDPTLDRRYLKTRLGPFITDWIAWLENEKGRSPRTIEQYERDLAHLAVRVPDFGPAEITKKEIRSFIASLSPGSRHPRLAAVKSFFKWLYREEIIERNPADFVDFPKARAMTIPRPFDQVEESRLLQHGPDGRLRELEVRDRLAITLLLTVGLRYGELAALKVGDIDPMRRIVRIEHGKGDRSRVISFGEGGDLERAFRFFVSTPLPAIKRLPEMEDHILYPFAIKVRSGGHWLGLDKQGHTRGMTYSPYWNWWKGVCRRAGVKYRSGHTARHTVGTNVTEDSGVERAQLVLGHSKIETTMRYAHLTDKHVREAVVRLEERRKLA